MIARARFLEYGGTTKMTYRDSRIPIHFFTVCGEISKSLASEL